MFKESTNDKWYRGYTSKTKSKFKWYSKEKSLAEQYADMNSLIYGGEKFLEEIHIDTKKLNLLILDEYDMNERYDEYEIDDILDEIDIEYEYIDLFDFSEDDIPLSRLINNILDEIFKKYDGILVLEDDIKTIG